MSTTTYRYDRFTPKLLMEDLRFHPGALRPGDAFPPVTLPTTDGTRVNLGGTASKPTLLVTGSLTCPMTESSMPGLHRLHREFGDRVDFVLLSVREAHPGEKLPQPRDEATAHDHARELAEHYQVPFQVAIDTIDGQVHQLLDNKPNTAYLLDTTGTVVFRAQWARQATNLREALDRVVRGEPLTRTANRAMMRPVVRAMGSVDATLTRAGPQARRDLWRSAPPMAIAGTLARHFPFKNPDQRGIAAFVTLLAAMALTIAAIVIAATAVA